SLAAPEPQPGWVWMATGLCSVVGVLLTPILLWAVRATDRFERRAPRLAAIVAAVVLVALLHSFIDHFIHEALKARFEPDAEGVVFVDKTGRKSPAPLHFHVLANFIALVWVHAGVTALGARSRFNLRVRRQEVATAEAKAAANQAKLETL